MEYYNNTICLTGSEITNVIPAGTFNSLCSRGKVSRVRRACLETPALYAVDSFPSKYKVVLYAQYKELGDEEKRKELIEQSGLLVQSIEPDTAAMDFYATYKKPNGEYLTEALQQEYYHNAIILNACKRTWEHSYSQHAKQGKKGKMIRKGDYWKKVASALPRVMDKYPHSLPEYWARLQEKYEDYVRNGYEVLITGKLGNKNRAKVRTDEQQSFIIELLRLGNNLPYAQIAKIYNATAQVKEWDEIDEATIGVWSKKYSLETYAGRNGKTELYNNKMMQVKRSRPKSPLLFWSVDGWTTELLYQKTEERNGKQVTTYHNRLTTVFVVDTSINYIIGYAIGDHETPELITEALRNALDHTAELFGARYRAAQIQSDRYGNGAMKPIYEAACKHYTPARAHNAKAKPVEPFNRDFNRDCQLMLNWSGHNVTSRKENQPNIEILNKNKKNFPDAQNCRLQIETIITRRRAELRGQFMELWGKADNTNLQPIDTESFLYYFGNIRIDRKKEIVTNQLTGAGLIATILGEKHTYDSFDINFRLHGGEKWILRYDPKDLTKVLATNKEGTVRFLLEEKYIQPMALAERQEGDAAELQRINDFNAELEAHIINTVSHSSEVVREQILGKGLMNDTLEKLMLSDSTGQHKDVRSIERKAASLGDAVEIKFTKKRERAEKKIFRDEYQQYVDAKVNLEEYAEFEETAI